MPSSLRSRSLPSPPARCAAVTATQSVTSESFARIASRTSGVRPHRSVAGAGHVHRVEHALPARGRDRRRGQPRREPQRQRRLVARRSRGVRLRAVLHLRRRVGRARRERDPTRPRRNHRRVGRCAGIEFRGERDRCPAGAGQRERRQRVHHRVRRVRTHINGHSVRVGAQRQERTVRATARGRQPEIQRPRLVRRGGRWETPCPRP